MKDAAGEACALLNLANCLSSRSEFSEAIPYYEQYLMLSQELADVEGEAKACHFLGYAHYCIGNYREAVRYYDQDLALAKDLQDKMNMGRAYCNLGLAHLALCQTDTALECQKYFLAIAHMTNNSAGKFRALGNIGDVLIKMNEMEEAIKMYHRQLALARSIRDREMEAGACGALGMAHRMIKRFDKALGNFLNFSNTHLNYFFTSRVSHTRTNIETRDIRLTRRMPHAWTPRFCTYGIRKLQSRHKMLPRTTPKVPRTTGLRPGSSGLRKLGYHKVGRQKLISTPFCKIKHCRLNMGHYEDAIGYLEQQLATLERLSTPTAQLDRGRAFGSLGDCYEALGDPEEASKCHEQYLSIALKLTSAKDQERAYRGLGKIDINSKTGSSLISSRTFTKISWESTTSFSLFGKTIGGSSRVGRSRS